MKQIQTNVGVANVINEFLSEIEAAPNQIRELLLVSPFVELSNERSKSGTKLSRLIRKIISTEGRAVLISDDTPSRREDFLRAIDVNRDLAGALLLCKGLHAKCGLATNSFGNQTGFLGSANLTDGGLCKNAEIVFGLSGKAYGGQGWHLVGQLRLAIEHIRSKSFQVNKS